jgi:hypothetical protein
MKSIVLISRSVTLLLLLLLAAVVVPPRACGNVAPAMAEAPTGAPKSVFNSQPGFGKDPFFPTSTRLRVRPPVQVTDPASVHAGVLDSFVLKGLAVLNQRKLAIINNYTVETGEEFTVKVSGKVFKVKCVEIKTNSVIINVNGSSKELQLRPGL